MLVSLLYYTVCYPLTSFFCVFSWSVVPVGSCICDIKGFLRVRKTPCKRKKNYLLSESTLEKILARNLLTEQEKSRSSWRNIRAVVECMGWSKISGKLDFGAMLQYIYPWQLLCLSPTAEIFFLCHFLKSNNPAASFTQWIHLAPTEVGWQSSTGWVCSGKGTWPPAHPSPHGLLLSCLLIQPSVLLCYRLLGPDSQFPFEKEERRKTNPSKLAALVLDVQALSYPFPGRRCIFHA